MEKHHLLKLFKEWEERGIKENGAGSKFKYDICDTLKEFFVNATMY
jgi:hypothetical protein